jgi:peroxiredoxin
MKGGYLEMNLIKVGENAPEFKVTDNNENDIRLADYRGKRVLLSWHPLAWTPVCTDQMRALENNWQAFERLNTVPLGFSVDPAPTKKVWAIALAITQLILPSDFWPHGKVARDYGIFNETDGVSERANIIVDENGKVKWVKVYPSAQLPDLNEVFGVLAKG